MSTHNVCFFCEEIRKFQHFLVVKEKKKHLSGTFMKLVSFLVNCDGCSDFKINSLDKR